MSRQLEIDFNRADNSIRQEVRDLLSPFVKRQTRMPLDAGKEMNDGAQISIAAQQEKPHTQAL